MLNNKYYNKMEMFFKLQDAKARAIKLGRKVQNIEKVKSMDTEINLLLLRYLASRSSQDLNELAIECEKHLDLNLKYVYDSIPIYYTKKINNDFFESKEYKRYIDSVSIQEDK